MRLKPESLGFFLLRSKERSYEKERFRWSFWIIATPFRAWKDAAKAGVPWFFFFSALKSGAMKKKDSDGLLGSLPRPLGRGKDAAKAGVPWFFSSPL
jgi:hypothetical protein